MESDVQAKFKPQVFTPESLGRRWNCSARHIRKCCELGELPFFRVGSMIRIPVDAVERIEQCQIGDLESSVVSGPLSGTRELETTESDGVISLEQQTVRKRPAARRLDLRN